METKNNLSQISVRRIESRKFIRIGESEIEIKDYKINSSGNGDTELTIIIDKGAAVFGITF